MQQVKQHKWFATPRWEPAADDEYIVNKHPETTEDPSSPADTGPHVPTTPSHVSKASTASRADDTLAGALPLAGPSHAADIVHAGSSQHPAAADGAELQVPKTAAVQHKAIPRMPIAGNKPPAAAPQPIHALDRGCASAGSATAAGSDTASSPQHSALVRMASSSSMSASNRVSIVHAASPTALGTPGLGSTGGYTHTDWADGACSTPLADATLRSRACMTALPLQSQNSLDSGSMSPAVWQSSTGGSPQNGDSSTSWSSSPSRSMAAGIGGSLPYSATGEFSPAHADETSAWNSPLASGTPSNCPTPSSTSHTAAPGSSSGLGIAGARGAQHAAEGAERANSATQQLSTRPGRASSGGLQTAAAANAAAAVGAGGVLRPGARRRAASAGSLSALPKAVRAAFVGSAAPAGATVHAPGLSVDTSHGPRRVAVSQPPLIDLPSNLPPLQPVRPLGADLGTVAERGESMDK